MNLNDIRKVYLMGIGGVGMSGLARYFNHRGCRVWGYDRTESALTRQLKEEGIIISYQDDVGAIPEPFRVPTTVDNLIIYTPALSAQSALLTYFSGSGYTLFKRAEVLGMISRNHFTIAVAGTHGKTTTTAMITQILRHAQYPCSAFIGGVAANIESNVWLDDSSETMVVEADEFDRSFLHLHPNIAIVTSTDSDHLDIYGDHAQLMESFRLFLDQVSEKGVRIVRKELELPAEVTYAADQEADAYAFNIRIEQGKYVFDLNMFDEVSNGWVMGIPGVHNIENALAAITAGRRLKLDYPIIKEALAQFKGVKRRFEYIVNTDRHVFIDDYAHHPNELKACFSAIRALYPEKRLTVIFQPHLFSRTRDFMAAFARELSSVDNLVLLPIYPARELPIQGVDSRVLLEKVSGSEAQLLEKEAVLGYIQRLQPELLLTVGAGDIDRMVPKLKEVLNHA